VALLGGKDHAEALAVEVEDGTQIFGAAVVEVGSPCRQCPQDGAVSESATRHASRGQAQRRGDRIQIVVEIQ